LGKATISFVMSVCLSSWSNSAPTGRIFMKFDIRGFFENLSIKLKFHQNLTRIKGTLHENLCTFMIISRWILLRMRNVPDKIVEKIKTHILCSKTFSRKSFHLWDNVEKYGRARQFTDDNIIRRMRFACWITKATHTHSQYVILLFHSNNCYATRLRVTLHVRCLFCFFLRLPTFYYRPVPRHHHSKHFPLRDFSLRLSQSRYLQVTHLLLWDAFSSSRAKESCKRGSLRAQRRGRAHWTADR
jgi:hypothetical protein